MSLIATLDTATKTNPANATPAPQVNEVALRAAAAQFEALLLTQLTASLNPKEEDEDALFSNSGGGMNLSKQMYSEQLAKSMSESGGIGIADMIMAQVHKRTAHAEKSNANHVTERALSAAREIKTEAAKNLTTKTSSGLSTAKDLYPDAIIISEASTSAATAVRALPATSLNAVNTFIPNESRAAVGATRPRRVHSVEMNAPAFDKTPATLAPRLTAPGSMKASKSRVAYVSLQVPVHGQIRSEFGMRRDPINGRMRLHQGIDIAAKSGTPIAAAAAGTVVFAGKNKGYGNMVMIEHADGRRTVYAHAKSLFVKAGDIVTGGQTIASVGSTGHSTGPHVHFEVRESNAAVNPLKALSNDLAFARR
jgi:murein DD-endopeptidase MepM/ murein hydrolase activator NlpD